MGAQGVTGITGRNSDASKTIATSPEKVGDVRTAAEIISPNQWPRVACRGSKS